MDFTPPLSPHDRKIGNNDVRRKKEMRKNEKWGKKEEIKKILEENSGM